MAGECEPLLPGEYDSGRSLEDPHPEAVGALAPRDGSGGGSGPGRTVVAAAAAAVAVVAVALIAAVAAAAGGGPYNVGDGHGGGHVRRANTWPVVRSPSIIASPDIHNERELCCVTICGRVTRRGRVYGTMSTGPMEWSRRRVMRMMRTSRAQARVRTQSNGGPELASERACSAGRATRTGDGGEDYGVP